MKSINDKRAELKMELYHIEQEYVHLFHLKRANYPEDHVYDRLENYYILEVRNDRVFFEMKNADQLPAALVDKCYKAYIQIVGQD